MHLVRHAALAVAATTTAVLGLANSAQASTPHAGTAQTVVSVRPGTVRAGHKVTVTTTAYCQIGTPLARSRAFSRASVALTATTGYGASGKAIVRKRARPGTYTVTVTCAGKPAATGKLTVSRATSRACRYRVVNVRRGHHLNVRSGQGTHRRVIDSLNWSDRRVHGSCNTYRGWVKVKADNGRTGWSYSRYLHRFR